MTYYDRWNDRNREAYKQGEKDAFYRHRSHSYDYDPYTERGAAYDDGYREERNRIERREEEMREEERQEREHRERMERNRQQAEEEYYRNLEQQESEDQEECNKVLDELF